MQQLEWHKETRKVSELKAAEYNPRKMNESEERDLTASIEEFGAVVPVVVNIGKRNNVLIGGHQRTTVYGKQGIEEVDVMVPSRELTRSEETRLNLRLNKNIASWDYEKLKEIDLTVLLEVGFDENDMQVVFDDVEVLDDNFNVAKRIKEITKARVKTGEVWQLGKHRLMCGDSTDSLNVDRLMGKDLADVLYIDAPGNNFKGKKKEEEYAEFNDSVIKNATAHAKPNHHAFFWCEDRYIGLLQMLFRDNKLVHDCICIWIQQSADLKPGIAFSSIYAPCVYGTKGKPYLNSAYRGLTGVLNKEVSIGNQVQEDVMDMLNLWIARTDGTINEKPVSLNEKPLKRCSAPGHIILDMFGRSGSLLVATEQLGRICMVMEKDPMMATLIIDRWEIFTNQKAKKV